MGDKTGIEWANSTWNPVTGCTKVSAGCDNCYAETFAERWRGTPGHHFEQGFDVRLWPDRLTLPLRWKNPRRIFVNSMSDVFHEAVPDDFIAQMFAVMASAQRHTFQVLTKRHGRMRSLLSSADFQAAVGEATARLLTTGRPDFRALGEWPLPNVWLGVSVEDQRWADIRIPALIETAAAVRFLSCEPLLGSVDLNRYLWLVGASTAGPFHDYAGRRRGRGGGIGGQALSQVRARDLHWVIAGGESGSRARPMHPDWARRLRDDCQAADVPFFFKQWGEWSPLGPAGRAFHSVADDGTVYAPGDLAWPDGPRWGEAVRACHDRAHLTAMYRVGKRAAGHELDGQMWQQFPSVAEAVPA